MHDRVREPPRRARLRTMAAALAAATMIAACGSASSPTASGSSTGASATGSTSPALAFSKCMRANGVPNFPDLSSFGMQIAAGSGQAISVNGVSLNGPAYQAARAKCQKYLPAHETASLSPQAQAQQRASGLKFANCMRSHGVPNFPDPKYYNGGQVVYFPGLNPAAPAFQTAAKSCGGFGKGKE
jgi:hypothetical protein